MSGGISIGFVDIAVFLFALDHVRCFLIRSFLVRNWCGTLRKGNHAPDGRPSLDQRAPNWASASPKHCRMVSSQPYHFPAIFFPLQNLAGLPFGHVAVADGLVNCASRGMQIALSGRTAPASSPELGVLPQAAIAGCFSYLSVNIRLQI